MQKDIRDIRQKSKNQNTFIQQKGVIVSSLLLLFSKKLGELALITSSNCILLLLLFQLLHMVRQCSVRIKYLNY